MGLSVPAGLFNLSDPTNLGSGGPLVNLGAVPFGVGINGLAATSAVFAGSTGQALYIADTGAADPFRIKTGSWGCWARSAKRGATQTLLSKFGAAGTAATLIFALLIEPTYNKPYVIASNGAVATLLGNTDVCDDRWHFLVGTHDGTTLRIYVDGQPEGAMPLAGPLLNIAAPLNIGAYGADGTTAATAPSYGRVDEAFVTADVLTDDQIRLLYATRLAHTLGAIPTSLRLAVHRRRKGASWAVADFTTQPVRLHNFTGGALTDQGSGAVALTANPGTGTITDVAGADGTTQPTPNRSSARTPDSSATDAGLPGDD
jgi:hypothetical protein